MDLSSLAGTTGAGGGGWSFSDSGNATAQIGPVTVGGLTMNGHSTSWATWAALAVAVVALVAVAKRKGGA